MSVVVVGKNSFIGQHLQETPACKSWTFLTHEEALAAQETLRSVDILINCAFSPKLYDGEYQPEEDIDSRLAEIIKESDTHYVMLSSRMVYGEQEHVSEQTEPSPATPYGRNKLQIEQQLTDILGDGRLCILRCTNIFGFEYGRRFFFGQMLTTLKEKDKIVFDMAPATKKDFLPVDVLCATLTRITERKIAGIYNAGSGIATTCGDVAGWVIEGYGQGILEVTDETVKGQFFMDVSKITQALELPAVSEDQIRQACVALGRRLKST